MKTFNYKNALGLLLIVAALSTACDNEYGLLASIQLEEKESSNKIFVNALTKSIVSDTSSYYAALAHIFSRSVSTGSTWNEVTPSAFGMDSYFCISIAVANSNTVYAVIANSSGVNTIYEKSGSTWSPVSAFSSETVETIYGNGSMLYAVVINAGNYELKSWNGTVKSAAIGAASSDRIAGVIEGAGFTWSIRGRNLYQNGTNLGTIGTSTANLVGITFDSGSDLIVVSADGYIAKYGDTTWTTPYRISSSDTLFGVQYIVNDDLFVVGTTDSSGYYEVNSALSSSSACTASGSLLVPADRLSTNPMKDMPTFCFFEDGNLLFACTSSLGTQSSSLWRNEYSGGAWSGWTAE